MSETLDVYPVMELGRTTITNFQMSVTRRSVLLQISQVDNDGTQTCDDFSGVVRLYYQDKAGIVSLKFSKSAKNNNIDILLPDERNVKLEIYDLQGNMINTLFEGLNQHST
jgi:hypothetical protein